MIMLCISCDQLFFPPTGVPSSAPRMRSTPQGLIDQLMRSYEEKRVDLFEDLLPRNGTFRFYVSSNFASIYSTRSYITYEPEIAKYNFVDGLTHYYYWGQADEVSRHRNLFSQVEMIEFSEPIIHDDLVYTVTEDNDTTHVEVLMTTGVLRVHLANQIFSTEIERQVFFLERDKEGLWVIRDWFDLGNAPN
ncbi:hypothetical protein CHISP_2165 [Chitinispirillum alkaliphilum]|nr:hypothetical protein CHISP_2165 [Chitinispirillum alkaliphilum]